MRLIGFNFKKINIEKFTDSFRDTKIDSKINIETIEEVNSDILQEKGAILKVFFDYNVDYIPKKAKVELSGELLLTLTLEQSKEIIQSWKKKKLPEPFKLSIFNIILRKSNVKALELEEDMNLPLHIPFPSLKPQTKEESTASK